MKTHVTVVPSDKLIIVDELALQFDFALPEGMPKGLHAIQWHNGKGDMEANIEGVYTNAELTPDNYDIYVQPFVSLWETEKYRIDNPPPPTLEEAKTEKLTEIKSAFKNEESSGEVDTALGWPSDANRNARENIAGLIAITKENGAATVTYRDYNNDYHDITLAQLEAIYKEVNAKLNGNHAKKSTLDQAVAAATTVEAVEAVSWE